MSNASILFTMGTALNRAAETGLPVRLLVEGQWLSGSVAGSDGHGVVLENTDGMHYVVRTERISAVQMELEEGGPSRTSIDSRPATSGFREDGPARPMPAYA